jgi:hypothetical protein
MSEVAVDVTRRASQFDRTRYTRCLIEVLRGPREIGRVRSHVIGRATASALRHATKPHKSMLTGRATPFDRTRCTRRPIGVQRAPHAIKRVRSHVTGCATVSDRHIDTRSPLGA